MNCDEVRNRLSDYLDGETSAGERKAIGEHTISCPSCRGELYELAKTIKHLSSLSEVEPPPLFTQRVMRRVREEAGPGKGLLRKLFFPLHVKLPAEALAVALVAVAAMYVFNTIRPEAEVKVASRPAAEAPEPPAKTAPPAGEEFAALRDEAKEAPAEGQHIGLQREPEDRAEAFRKSESPFKARKPAAQAREAESLDAASPWEEGVPSGGGAALESGAAPEAVHNAIEEKAVFKDKGARFEVTVFVPDVAQARAKVEDAVKKAGGRLVEEPPSEMSVVVAEIAHSKLAGLIKELDALGKVSPGSQAVFGDSVRLLIELREKSR